VPKRILRVVPDDADDLHRQFADAVAVKQVAKSVVEPAHHDEDLAWHVLGAQLPLHLVFAGQWLELLSDCADVAVDDIEFDPHEERIVVRVVELLGFGDVPAAIKEIPGDARSYSRSVTARQCQDLRVGHRVVQIPWTLRPLQEAPPVNSRACAGFQVAGLIRT